MGRLELAHFSGPLTKRLYGHSESKRRTANGVGLCYILTLL